ncbi:MAG: dihydropteroate synthase [Bacteroidales bacterium]|nr:dihydropteroate synthase [Bacteroidales bacterium]MDD3891287.1 dihydropteroate synthase [Bacteroidales bacterium]
MENSKLLIKNKQNLVCNGNIISLERPLVMGIINITRDSFYAKSQFMLQQRIAKRAKEILEQGGSIIDIGACSTRPGSQLISEKEEILRLSKGLTSIRKHLPDSIISVDTFRASVAKHVVNNFNVNIINDISAGNMDEKMVDTIASLSVPYIAMHMQGTPQNMQQNPSYSNVVKEIISFFAQKIEHLHKAGVRDVIIDPGFGFGKTIEHNYALLQNLEAFKLFGLPILVGLSRKSMVYKTLNIEPEEALNGTTAINTIALLKGANILRVHDVREAIETISLTTLTSCQPKGFK